MSKIKSIINKTSVQENPIAEKMEYLVLLREKLKNDKSPKNLTVLKKVPKYLWKDMVFARQAVEISFNSLIFIDPEIKKDSYFQGYYQEIIMNQRGISRIINTLIPEEDLKNITSNEKIMKFFIEHDYDSYKYASDEIKNNLNIIKGMLERTTYRPSAINVLGEDILKKENLMIEIIKNFPWIVQNKKDMKVINLSEKIILDNFLDFNEELMKFFVEKIGINKFNEEQILSFLDKVQNFNIFKNNSNHNFSDEVIFKFAKKNYVWLPDEYKKDINLAKKVLMETGSQFSDYPVEIQNDRDIALWVSQYRYMFWKYFNKTLKNDYEIILTYAYNHRLSSDDLKNVDEKLLQDSLLLDLLVSKNKEHAKLIKLDNHEHLKILYKNLEDNDGMYDYLDKDIKENIEVNAKIIRDKLLSPLNFYKIPIEMIMKEEIISEIVQIKSEHVYKFVVNLVNKVIDPKFNIKYSREFILKTNQIIEKNYNLGENSNKKLYDKYKSICDEIRVNDLQERLAKEVQKEETTHVKRKI